MDDPGTEEGVGDDGPATSPHQPGGDDVDSRCPVCGGRLVQEKCKVICRSGTCVYRIVFNCSEF